MNSRHDDLRIERQSRRLPLPRLHPAMAMLAALLTSAALMGCGDGPISQAQAQIDAAPGSAVQARAGAAHDDPYSAIRPASVDDPIDPKQQSDIAG